MSGEKKWKSEFNQEKGMKPRFSNLSSRALANDMAWVLHLCLKLWFDSLLVCLISLTDAWRRDVLCFRQTDGRLRNERIIQTKHVWTWIVHLSVRKLSSGLLKARTLIYNVNVNYSILGFFKMFFIRDNWLWIYKVKINTNRFVVKLYWSFCNLLWLYLHRFASNRKLFPRIPHSWISFLIFQFCVFVFFKEMLPELHGHLQAQVSSIFIFST